MSRSLCGNEVQQLMVSELRIYKTQYRIRSQSYWNIRSYCIHSPTTRKRQNTGKNKSWHGWIYKWVLVKEYWEQNLTVFLEKWKGLGMFSKQFIVIELLISYWRHQIYALMYTSYRTRHVRYYINTRHWSIRSILEKFNTHKEYLHDYCSVRVTCISVIWIY